MDIMKMMKKFALLRQLMSSAILVCFVSSLIVPPASAQVLPMPATSVGLTPGYQPPVLLGLKIHPENPLLLDFIVDQGQSNLSQDELKAETEKLVKYFLAALTIPDKEVWVNLSPTEKDRIIPDVLGQTMMGKTMLEQDYVLKQLASSLTNPNTELGKKYWSSVGSDSQDLSKVWIVPSQAEVLESNGIVLVGEKRLKVRMDEGVSSSQVFRATILPNIEKEVNEGKTFADVRQVYNSVILAAWYKQALKESLLGKVYTDQGKVAGVESGDKEMKQRIYEQYLAAFKKGAYNLIKEETDATTGETIPRKYFSGGENFVEMSRIVSSSAISAAQAGQMLEKASASIVTTQLGTSDQEIGAIRNKVATSSPVVLVVEDSPRTRATLVSILEEQGYTVLQARNPNAAKEVLEREGAKVEFITTDGHMLMSDEDKEGSADAGINLIRDLSKSHPDIPVVMVTGDYYLRQAAEKEKATLPNLRGTLGKGVVEGSVYAPGDKRVLQDKVYEILWQTTGFVMKDNPIIHLRKSKGDLSFKTASDVFKRIVAIWSQGRGRDYDALKEMVEFFSEYDFSEQSIEKKYGWATARFYDARDFLKENEPLLNIEHDGIVAIFRSAFDVQPDGSIVLYDPVDESAGGKGTAFQSSQLMQSASSAVTLKQEIAVAVKELQASDQKFATWVDDGKFGLELVTEFSKRFPDLYARASKELGSSWVSSFLYTVVKPAKNMTGYTPDAYRQLDELNGKLKSDSGRWVIAIDGKNGAGKTTLWFGIQSKDVVIADQFEQMAFVEGEKELFDWHTEVRTFVNTQTDFNFFMTKSQVDQYLMTDAGVNLLDQVEKHFIGQSFERLHPKGVAIPIREQIRMVLRNFNNVDSFTKEFLGKIPDRIIVYNANNSHRFVDDVLANPQSGFPATQVAKITVTASGGERNLSIVYSSITASSGLIDADYAYVAQNIAQVLPVAASLQEADRSLMEFFIQQLLIKSFALDQEDPQVITELSEFDLQKIWADVGLTAQAQAKEAARLLDLYTALGMTQRQDPAVRDFKTRKVVTFFVVSDALAAQLESGLRELKEREKAQNVFKQMNAQLLLATFNPVVGWHEERTGKTAANRAQAAGFLVLLAERKLMSDKFAGDITTIDQKENAAMRDLWKPANATIASFDQMLDFFDIEQRGDIYRIPDELAINILTTLTDVRELASLLPGRSSSGVTLSYEDIAPLWDRLRRGKRGFRNEELQQGRIIEGLWDQLQDSDPAVRREALRDILDPQKLAQFNGNEDLEIQAAKAGLILADSTVFNYSTLLVTGLDEIAPQVQRFVKSLGGSFSVRVVHNLNMVKAILTRKLLRNKAERGFVMILPDLVPDAATGVALVKELEVKDSSPFFMIAPATVEVADIVAQRDRAKVSILQTVFPESEVDQGGLLAQRIWREGMVHSINAQWRVTFKADVEKRLIKAFIAQAKHSAKQAVDGGVTIYLNGLKFVAEKTFEALTAEEFRAFIKQAENLSVAERAKILAEFELATTPGPFGALTSKFGTLRELIAQKPLLAQEIVAVNPVVSKVDLYTRLAGDAPVGQSRAKVYRSFLVTKLEDVNWGQVIEVLHPSVMRGFVDRVSVGAQGFRTTQDKEMVQKLLDVYEQQREQWPQEATRTSYQIQKILKNVEEMALLYRALVPAEFWGGIRQGKNTSLVIGEAANIAPIFRPEFLSRIIRDSIVITDEQRENILREIDAPDAQRDFFMWSQSGSVTNIYSTLPEVLNEGKGNEQLAYAILSLNPIFDFVIASSSVGEQSIVASSPAAVGGIDFDPTNMNLQIKRDGRGVPLPLPQQNLQQINIEGLFPVIINIVPITTQSLPIFLGQTVRFN
jgi:CheY-like chemotaxis protein